MTQVTINVTSPIMICIVTCIVIVATGHELRPSLVFTMDSIFFILRMQILDLSWRIGEMVEVLVSLRRIQAFLEHEPVDPNLVKREEHFSQNIVEEINNADFAWDTKRKEKEMENNEG